MTLMKNINSLNSNIKQIARNVNRLINCLIKQFISLLKYFMYEEVFYLK